MPKINFLFFALAVISWSFSLLYHDQSLLSDVVWTRTITLLTLAGIFGLLFLIIAISQKRPKESISFISFFSTICILVILPFLIQELSLPPTAVVFLLLLFTYAAWIAIILFERSLKNPRDTHLQTMAVLFGFGLFASVAMVLAVFVPLATEKTSYMWPIPVFSLLFIIFTALVLNPHYSLKKIGYLGVKLSTGTLGIILLLLSYFSRDTNLKILTIVAFLLFCALAGRFLKVSRRESEQKKEIKKLSTEWEELNHSKDQFILSFQHHLRTPLVSVRGYLEMILNGAYGREENPIIRKRLLDVKKGVDILYSLIEGLLDMQKAHVGKNYLSKEDCQIDALIESVIEELKIEAEKKELYIKFNKGQLPTIKADKIRIRSALWNLVDNAIKYTNSGGVSIASEFRDKKAIISVTDTGIGMKKEEIDRFLKKHLFERGEEAKKLCGPGMGIGLSLAIEFVEAHGGKIWAESKGRNEGSIFWLEIPAEQKQNQIT